MLFNQMPLPIKILVNHTIFGMECRPTANRRVMVTFGLEPYSMLEQSRPHTFGATLSLRIKEHTIHLTHFKKYPNISYIYIYL